MTAGTDFVTRAHALWRVRMAQWQQRFGFFARLVLLSGGAGAIIAPQFVMSAAELKVAGQCLGAKALVILGEMAGKDMMMNVSLEGRRWTVSSAAFAADPLIAGTFSKAVTLLIIGAVLGCVLGLVAAWLLQRTMSAQGHNTLADRATGSVLFMLAKAANLIQFLKVEQENAARFAFRDFIVGLDRIEGAKPWIFVPRKEDYFEAAKPLMACWLECAASAVLGLSPSPERRIWFVLDELADLPRVENLARLLPEGRKFGAAIVLTFQALGQMRHRYGDNIAEAMLACCNTKLFLQTVDRETRQWASETIGQCEVEMRVATDTLAIGKDVPRTTIATQRQFRAAVLESELRLAPHQGYLLLPDGLPVARIGLTAEHITRRGSPRQPAFVAGDPASTLWSRVSAVVVPSDAEPDAGAKAEPEGGPV